MYHNHDVTFDDTDNATLEAVVNAATSHITTQSQRHDSCAIAPHNPFMQTIDQKWSVALLKALTSMHRIIRTGLF